MYIADIIPTTTNTILAKNFSRDVDFLESLSAYAYIPTDTKLQKENAITKSVPKKYV